MLWPLLAPKWKWDEIGMEFLVGLPREASGEDAIWVLVDHLMKMAHFILMKVKDSIDKVVGLYVKNSVRLQRLPTTIVSNHDSRFTSKFWRSLQKEMSRELKSSMGFHP
jgi:hypothetical protein